MITVGDCFSGGGSIPFESARIGAKAYGSDLNPIASLLSWANINILGANEEQLREIDKFRQDVYDEVNKEILNLGIETNEKGDRAVSYIYCVETACPECGYRVPLAPSWIIGKGTKTIAILKENDMGFDIAIKSGVSTAELSSASNGTATSKGLLCPHCKKTTPLSAIRHDTVDESGNTVYGLRKWERNEFEFRNDDVYSERLYAIKYEHIEIVNAVWYNQNCKHRIFSTKARNTFEKQTPPQIADTFACDAVFYHRNSYRYYRYVLQFKEHLSASQK